MEIVTYGAEMSEEEKEALNQLMEDLANDGKYAEALNQQLNYAKQQYAQQVAQKDYAAATQTMSTISGLQAQIAYTEGEMARAEAEVKKMKDKFNDLVIKP